MRKSPAGRKQHRIWRRTPGLMPQAMHPRCTRRTGRRTEKRSVNGNVPSRTAACTSGPTRRAAGRQPRAPPEVALLRASVPVRVWFHTTGDPDCAALLGAGERRGTVFCPAPQRLERSACRRTWQAPRFLPTAALGMFSPSGGSLQALKGISLGIGAALEPASSWRLQLPIVAPWHPRGMR